MKSSRARSSVVRRLAGLLVVVVMLIGCRQKMAEQPHGETYEASDFFPNGAVARSPVEGTVARGSMAPGDSLTQAKTGDDYVRRFPLDVDRSLLERGRQRYNIFCAPCHDAAGTGRGIVVHRGFRQPAAFHIKRLRESAEGYFFDVITNGFGTMPSYGRLIPPRDRWAITAYIRALQLSQNTPAEALSTDDKRRLEEGS